MIWGLGIAFSILWLTYRKIALSRRSSIIDGAFSKLMGMGRGSFDGARASWGRARHGGDGQVASLLLLFASDVLVGVGLRSAVRSFLLSHVPLVEFSTGVEVDVRRLERPRPRPRRALSPQISDGGRLGDSSRPEKTPFIVDIRGLKNRGQTCYANSVLQALASLQPLYNYLESLEQRLPINNEGSQENISSALFQTVQYINGHRVAQSAQSRVPTRSILSFGSLFSSSPSGDPQRVMDIVARHHSQFRSRNGMEMSAGMSEQQDCHEFFTGLMDVLSSEDRMGRGSESRSTNLAKHACRGLADVDQMTRSGTGGEGGDISDTSAYVHSGQVQGGHVEELEEEKKHDERALDGASPYNDYHGQTKKDRLAATSPDNGIPSSHSQSSTIRNPFDGWSGSTIKCATCHHIRPIRSTPFLTLSLPIAGIQSKYLEDFLSAEYGGFATAEVVSDVQCFSCAIRRRIRELEDEEILLNGATSSIQRRSKGKKILPTNKNGSRKKVDDPKEEINGLVLESHRIRRRIAVLEALDPDVDEDMLECRDVHDEDAELEIQLGICDSLPPIAPLRGDAHKASLVMRPPEALCVHIQRRHYDLACQRMVKVTRHIQFEEDLDIRPYCAYEARVPYKLMSVIEHKGNAFGGHYQTYRRVGLERNEWVLVSDESVSFRTWNDVRGCQAYMLFYAACCRQAEPF